MVKKKKISFFFSVNKSRRNQRLFVFSPIKRIFYINAFYIKIKHWGGIMKPYVNVTFLCRLHIGGGGRFETLESPLLSGCCCSEVELGFDAQAGGILHSTSDAQLSSGCAQRAPTSSPTVLVKSGSAALRHTP